MKDFHLTLYCEYRRTTEMHSKIISIFVSFVLAFPSSLVMSTKTTPPSFYAQTDAIVGFTLPRECLPSNALGSNIARGQVDKAITRTVGLTLISNVTRMGWSLYMSCLYLGTPFQMYGSQLSGTSDLFFIYDKGNASCTVLDITMGLLLGIIKDVKVTLIRSCRHV